MTDTTTTTRIIWIEKTNKNKPHYIGERVVSIPNEIPYMVLIDWMKNAGYYRKKTWGLVELTRLQNIDYILSGGSFSHINHQIQHKIHPWDKLNIISTENWEEYVESIKSINK